GRGLGRGTTIFPHDGPVDAVSRVVSRPGPPGASHVRGVGHARRFPCERASYGGGGAATVSSRRGRDRAVGFTSHQPPPFAPARRGAGRLQTLALGCPLP